MPDSLPFCQPKGYTLYQNDCLAVLQGMPDSSIDACLTDPPYQVNLSAACPWDRWPARGEWQEIARVLKPTGILAFTMAPHVAHKRVADVEAAGFRVLEVGFWVYASGRPVSGNRLKRNYDLVYFMSVEGTRLFTENARLHYRAGACTRRGGSGQRVVGRGCFGRQFRQGALPRSYVYSDTGYFPSNVACLAECDAFAEPHYPLIFAVKRVHPVRPVRAKHPTEKPLDLVAQLIRLVSMPGDVVLDPFMGSGAIGEAALLLGRRFVGVESEPKYFALAQENIAAVAAQPRLIADAEPASSGGGG